MKGNGMAEDEVRRKALRLSALVYTTISVAAAGAFFAASTALGYNNVARVGGTVWVFLLSMIITMPTIIPIIKKRLNK